MAVTEHFFLSFPFVNVADDDSLNGMRGGKEFLLATLLLSFVNADNTRVHVLIRKITIPSYFSLRRGENRRKCGRKEKQCYTEGYTRFIRRTQQSTRATSSNDFEVHNQAAPFEEEVFQKLFGKRRLANCLCQGRRRSWRVSRMQGRGSSRMSEEPLQGHCRTLR